MRLLRLNLFPVLLFVLLMVSSCKRRHQSIMDPQRPLRTLKEYFDKKYLLYKLPDNYYALSPLNHSFEEKGNQFAFKPFGYSPKLNLQYTHVYSPKCVYHNSDTVWKFAEVCFPNTCLSKGNAYASIAIKNRSSEQQTYHARLFYQNTSYWYPTDDSIDLKSRSFMENFYGASAVQNIVIAPGQDTVVKLPFTIDLDPKNEWGWFGDKCPARPGNYEFLALVFPDKKDILMHDDLDLKKINPFALVKNDQLNNGGKIYGDKMAYVGPHHFKFVFLDEYFDGTNDLTTNHIYLAKNGKEKPLCDTCSGWYRDVINERWTYSDFDTGFIHRAGYVKAEYGIKKENFNIDNSGITLKIPKSTPGNYNKTWGEFLFGQAFKYGHLTLRAKLAQMMNESGTPNGIIHNIWLYQRDFDEVDSTNPYHYLRNSFGRQPYEIDFEFWSSTFDTKTVWDPDALITYSIVDYMRDAKVKIKPNAIVTEPKTGDCINRTAPYALAWNGKQFNRSFFDSFHTYELYWYPDHVRFLVDGQEMANITREMASIPNRHMFLWIGSPMYQDGTWYSQSQIPFLKKDKYSVIDYIKIE